MTKWADLHAELKDWLAEREETALEQSKEMINRGKKLGVDCPPWDAIAQAYTRVYTKIEELEEKHE